MKALCVGFTGKIVDASRLEMNISPSSSNGMSNHIDAFSSWLRLPRPFTSTSNRHVVDIFNKWEAQQWAKSLSRMQCNQRMHTKELPKSVNGFELALISSVRMSTSARIHKPRLSLARWLMHDPLLSFHEYWPILCGYCIVSEWQFSLFDAGAA